MAATWENEHNSNMAAARVLLQRALRLMPENEQLWHEYFRLELIYIEKIKLRRRVLGIDQKKGTEEAMEVDEEEEEEDENMLKLPALTGEDVAQWKQDEEHQKKFKLNEKDAAALEEANNPILQGLLAKIIYDNAINAIPDKIEFRQRFVDIYREFMDTQQHIQHVYDTIRRDMNENPEARAFLASRHLFVLEKKEDEEGEEEEKSHYISVNDPAFVTAIRKSVQEFETATKELNTPKMWELYVTFLLNWVTLVSEENLKLYLNKLLQKTFKACQKQKKLSITLYELWTSFLVQISEDAAEIDTIATEGLKTYPESVKLWICRVDLAKDNSEEQLKLYTRGLDVSTESLLLWTSYKDWIISSSILSNEEKDQMLFRACEKATTLLPSVTTDSSDRNQIKQVLQTSYVEWAAELQGIDHARTVYKKIIKNFYPTYSFFMKCIEIENQYGSAESGQENVEYLYERTTRLADDKQGKPHSAEMERDAHNKLLTFLCLNIGSYISYLAYLYSQKKFQLANQVYNRAIKEVLDKDAFDLSVQKLKSSHQSTL